MDPGCKADAEGAGKPAQEGMEAEGQGGQGRPKRAVGRPRKTAVASFEVATESGRKRSAEWSLADQVASLRSLVQELVKQNQEKQDREEHVQTEVESLRKETEELRKTIQAWRQEQLVKEEAKDQGHKAFQSAVHE